MTSDGKSMGWERKIEISWWGKAQLYEASNGVQGCERPKEDMIVAPNMQTAEEER